MQFGKLVDGLKGRVGILTAALALGAGGLFTLSSALPVSADRDRPGTPNQVAAIVRDAFSIEVDWVNTAGEQVTYEARITANGTEIQGQAFGDDNGYTRHLFTNLGGNTTYCFALRARRTSDQVVSAAWSAWACADTPYPGSIGGTTPTPTRGSSAPTILTATGDSSGVVLIWMDLFQSNSMFFRIYRDGQLVDAVAGRDTSDSIVFLSVPYTYVDSFPVSARQTYQYKLCSAFQVGAFIADGDCSAAVAVKIADLMVDPNRPAPTIPAVNP